MNIHTLDISELTALNCTDLRITSASRAADSAVFSFCADSLNELSLWQFGDKIKLIDGNTTLFSGYVTTCPSYSTEATSQSYSVKPENIVALMDATPYSEPQSFDGFITNDARLVSAREALVKLTSAGLMAPDGSAASEAVQVDIDAEIMCPTGSGSQSCWSLANGCLHWVPDAVTWFSPETETLRIRRAADGDAVTIDATDGTVATISELEASSAVGWLIILSLGDNIALDGLYLNGVHIYDTISAEVTISRVVDLINSFSEKTGVVASAEESDNTVVRLTAITPGTDGNNITVASDNYRFNVINSTLKGGRDSGDSIAATATIQPWSGFPVTGDVGFYINGIHIYSDTIKPANGFELMTLINSFSEQTGVVASYKDWTPDIVLTATTPGAAGNNIQIRLDNPIWVLSGDYLEGGADGLQKNKLFSFAGYSSASFRERRDLCPPVVSVAWPDMGREYIFPEGATSSRLPWAFRFEIPSSGGAYNPKSPAQTRAAQQASAPKMTVSGFKVPAWQIGGKLTVESNGKPGEFLTFWKRWFPLLGKLPYTGLVFGNLIFEPVAGDVAFPPDEETGDSTVPTNYEAFSNPAKNIYVLNEGSFPASTESRDNLSGLNFCKGKLKQMIWNDRSIDLTQYATAEELYKFFTGTAKLSQRTAEPKKCRFIQLELEAVFIDRRRKKYKVGTNELVDGDPDYQEPEPEDGGGGSGGASSEQYRAAAQDYYNATRQLFFDGEITLHGVEGYSPGQLQGAILNITGGRTEWENMATPVVQAEWSPFRKTLTLSTGSPEILTLDERVQRMQLGRQSAAGAGTSFAQPPSASGGASSGDEDEERDFPMISPNISVSSVATKDGKPLNPLSLFADGNSWKLSEGVIPLPGGKVLNFEEKDVTDIVAANPGAKLRVYPKYDRTTRQWEAKIGIIKPKD